MHIPVFQYDSCEKRNNLKINNLKSKENDSNLFSQEVHTQNTNEKNENFWQSLRKLWSRDYDNCNVDETDDMRVKTQMSSLIKEVNVCENTSNKIKEKLSKIEELMNPKLMEENDDISNDVYRSSQKQLNKADVALDQCQELISSMESFNKDMNEFFEKTNLNIEEIVNSCNENNDYLEVIDEFKKILERNLENMSAEILEKWNETILEIKENESFKRVNDNKKSKNSSKIKMKNDENIINDKNNKISKRYSKRLQQQNITASAMASTPSTNYSYNRIFKTATTTTKTTTTTISTSAQKRKRKLQTTLNQQCSLKFAPTSTEQIMFVQEKLEDIAETSINNTDLPHKPQIYRSSRNKESAICIGKDKRINETENGSSYDKNSMYDSVDVGKAKAICPVQAPENLSEFAHPSQSLNKSRVDNKYIDLCFVESEDESVFSLQRFYGL